MSAAAPEAGLTETQVAVRSVAREVLGREADWSELATAGLLSLAVPPALGGEGLGLADLSILLHELGAAASTLPVWETVVCGVLPVAAAGTAEQQERLLAGVAEGTTRLAPALREPSVAITATPATEVVDGRVTGRKVGVTGADGAAHLLVTAVQDGRPVVALVEPTAPGVTLLPSRTSRGVTSHTVVLDGAPAEILGAEMLGAEVLGDGSVDAARLLREHALAGLLALGGGVLAGARDLTAGYLTERVQFGRRLAEFQAVAMQIADVYVASRMVKLAADNVVWR
ncbi:acyl-CoA dehydrogenase family protein, partial [Nocardioides sp.]|uniref:acyl-CoA dehydrogenase family protein n=1 Tax=Nocardioides sp. TaxID=35761 RepID=UPI0027342BEA